MSKSPYTLAVQFKSNERPFKTTHDPSPYGPKTDEEAVRWARGMAETMGGAYTVTLLKNGEVMPIHDAEGQET